MFLVFVAGTPSDAAQKIVRVDPRLFYMLSSRHWGSSIALVVPITMTVPHLESLFGDRIRTAPPSLASKPQRDGDGLISKEKCDRTRKAPRSHKGAKVTWGL